MKNKKNKPSKLALALFYWYCHPGYREELEGDLLERFNSYYNQHGYTKANQLFIKDVLLLFRPGIVGTIYQLTYTEAMTETKQNKRLFILLIGATSLLLIPFIAMNLTSEVNWKPFDFVIAGTLLLGTAFTLEIILRKVKTKQNRIILAIVLLLALLLIWVELAVGIIGTPFAGS